MRIVSETSQTILNTPTFALQGPQKKKKRENGLKKIFEEIIGTKISQRGKADSQSSPGRTRQEKPKEEHTEIQSKQTDKN